MRARARWECGRARRSLMDLTPIWRGNPQMAAVLSLSPLSFGDAGGGCGVHIRVRVVRGEAQVLYHWDLGPLRS